MFPATSRRFRGQVGGSSTHEPWRHEEHGFVARCIRNFLRSPVLGPLSFGNAHEEIAGPCTCDILRAWNDCGYSRPRRRRCRWWWIRRRWWIWSRKGRIWRLRREWHRRRIIRRSGSRCHRCSELKWIKRRRRRSPAECATPRVPGRTGHSQDRFPRIDGG